MMRIGHSRKPLALGSPSRAFALIRATLSRSQADLVLFLLTERIREPYNASQSMRRLGVRVGTTGRQGTISKGLKGQHEPA